MTAPPQPGFQFVVLDAQGSVAHRTVHAANLEQARQLATREGVRVLDEVSPQRGSGIRQLLGIIRSNATIDTVTFSQDLATLMEAGLTVKESVAAMVRKEHISSQRQVLARLNDSMSEGASFSRSLSAAGCFPGLLIATAAASEQTGDLATGLSRYAAHQDSLRLVRDRVVGACVYPLLLLAVGSLVILVLLGVVVPRFSRLIEMQDRELPALSQVLMAWGRFADTHPMAPWMLVIAAILLTLYCMAQWGRPDARRRWLARIPGVAKVVREFQHLQMYRTAAILTTRGIPIHRAFEFTADLLSPADRERLQIGLARMREGTSMSAALAECGLSDVMAQSMLTVAERSGAAAEMLDRIADFYERNLQRSIDLASRLIEPVLMIVFGFLIGGIVLLMYLPIFDLAASVG